MEQVNKIPAEKVKRNRTKGYYLQKISEHTGREILKQTKIKGIQKSMRKVAQQARQRKKQYYSLLEAQVHSLKQEITQLKQQNQELQLQLTHINSSQENQNDNTAFLELMEEMKRMSRNLMQNQSQEVDRSLSILRDKYGISGRQRMKEIETLFDRLVEVIMPMHFRVLMENSEDNRKFYSLVSQGIMDSSLKFSEVQKNALLQMRPLFCSYKKQYSKIFDNLSCLQQSIKYQNWVCQGVIDNIQQKMDSCFIGKLLLSLDQMRKLQIYPCNFWHETKNRRKYNSGANNHRYGAEIMLQQGNHHSYAPNQSLIFQCDNQIFDELFL